jgi:hypothetical protein
MEIAFFVILLCLVISLFLNVKIYNDFKNLSIENRKIKKEKQEVEKFKEDLISINIGDRIIYPNYSLIYDKGGDEEHAFDVTYELIVTDVTRDKVKVNAIDFTTTDNKINNDTSKKQEIINFIMDKWVDKSRVELIIDELHKRNLKLEKLGIK